MLKQARAEIELFDEMLTGLKQAVVSAVDGIDYRDEDSLLASNGRIAALVELIMGIMEERNRQSLALSMLFRNTVRLKQSLWDTRKQLVDFPDDVSRSRPPLIPSPGYLVDNIKGIEYTPPKTGKEE